MRLPTVGLLVLFLAVGALAASAVLGMRGGPRPANGRAASAPTALSAVEPPAGRPRVQVLNASSRPGLARRATRYLRARGFDVVEFGNAPAREDTLSRVADRGGGGGAARALADSLRIRRITREPDSLLLLEATVVLGRDWAPPWDTAAPPR